MQIKTFPGFENLNPVTDQDRIKHKPTYPQGFDRKVFNPKTGLGLLYRSQFEEADRETFFYNGIEVEFEDFWPITTKGKKNVIRAFYNMSSALGEWKVHTLWIPINKIDLDSLKKLELWTILPETVKISLEKSHVVQAQEGISDINERMEIARHSRKRDPANDNLPRELICCVPYCGNKMDYISPTMLLGKSEEKGCTPEEYVKSWKCSSCEPRKRKGRVKSSNPEFANLPKTMICKCGKEVVVNPAYLKSKAEKTNTTIQALIDGFVCQTCNPTKGRQKNITISEDGTTTTTTTTRGRKENPNTSWFGKSKELKCACGKIQPQHGSITDSQAKKAGKTYEEYVSSWLCMSCRPQGAKRIRKQKDGVTTTATTTTVTTENGSVTIPKETTCKGCGNPVKLVPSNIIEKAGILGISVDALIASYLCRKCGGRLTPNTRMAMLQKMSNLK